MTETTNEYITMSLTDFDLNLGDYEIVTEKIDPTTAQTYRDILDLCEKENGMRIAPLFLHRQVCYERETECKVKLCKNITANECGICMHCHPIYKDDLFPCYLKKK